MLEIEIKELTTKIEELISVLRSSPKIIALKEKTKQPNKNSVENSPQGNIDEVKAALLNLAERKDRETAKELLKKYKANKLTDLKADDYLKIIEDANNA